MRVCVGCVCVERGFSSDPQRKGKGDEAENLEHRGTWRAAAGIHTYDPNGRRAAAIVVNRRGAWRADVCNGAAIMKVELMIGAWGVDENGDAFDRTERIPFDAVRATGRQFDHPNGETTVERVVYDLVGGGQVTQVIKWGSDRRKCQATLE